MHPILPSVVLFFVALVGAVALVLWLSLRHEKRRTAQLRRVASSLGLAPLEASATLPPELTHFSLTTAGHSRVATGISTGSADGRTTVLFDYRYRTGGGQHSQIHRFTVVAFPDAGRRIPDFELGPENLLTKLGKLVGYRDIDFPEDGEFSKRYLLRGAEESAIRAAFHSELRSLLLGSPCWRVEARLGAVAITRTDGRWNLEDVPERLADARRIAAALGG